MKSSSEPEEDVEERLRQLAREWPADGTFVKQVMERVARLPASSKPARSPARWWVRTSLVAAAALLLALGMWQFVVSVWWPTTLYAQVRAATRKVGTIHTVMEVVEENGAVKRVGETWFARGRGFAVTSAESTRIDDGHFFWEHAKESKFASKMRSRGTDDLLDKMLEVQPELKDLYRRVPGQDRTIDGKPCQAYELSIPPERRAAGYDPEIRSLVFVSEDFLVRLVESGKIVGETLQRRSLWKWEYDVPVPEDAFRPQFPAGVEIVDTDRAFDWLVDLGRAVHVEEREGLIFAVHRLERFEHGGVLVMSSVRGTAETLKKYPLNRRMIQPGLFLMDPPATNLQTSPQGPGYFRIPLATVSHQGIDVQWWVMVPRGKPDNWCHAGPGQVQLDLGMTPFAGKYADAHKDRAGVIQHIYWKQTLAVPAQKKLPSQKAIAESVYADVALLPSIPSRIFDLGVEEVQGNLIGKRGTPQDTSAERFATAVAAHIRYWERDDIDFRIRQGEVTDVPFGGRSFYPMPVINLAYYRSVDDETLKRVAEQKEVRTILLRGTRISDKGLATLKSLEHLTQLDLSETEIDDAGLEQLRDFQSLKQLNVQKTKVTPAGIAQLKAALPELEVE